MKVEEVLSMFGRRHHQAITALDKFIKAGVPEEVNNRLAGRQLPSVLGSDAFRGWVNYNFIEPLKSDREIPDARRNLRPNVSLKTIDRFVRKAYGVTKGAETGRNQPNENEARAMAIYLMRTVGGAKHRDIAVAMGKMRTEAIAKSLHRFRNRIAHDQMLREKSETFLSQLLSNVQT